MTNQANLSALEDPPLGIKFPLLPPPTLGQTSFLQPKFLVPRVDLLAIDDIDHFVPEISERMPSKVVSATPIQLQIKPKNPQNTRLQKQAISSPSDSNYVADHDPTTQSVVKQIFTELNITEAVTSAQKSIPEIQQQFIKSQQNNVIETPNIQQASDQVQTENLTESAIAHPQTSIPQVQRQFIESQQSNVTEQISQQKAETKNTQATQEQFEADYLSHTQESDVKIPDNSQPRKMPESQRKFLESQQKNITSIANVQNKNIPTLPSVLQNISHIQTSLSDKKNRIVGSQSIVTPIENSWDSIDDLLGANTSNTHAPSVQRSPESNTDSYWSSIGELLLSSGSSRKKYSKPDSDTDNLNIMRKPEVYFTPQGYQSITPRIQRLANNQEVSSKSIPDVSVSSISDQKPEQIEGSAKDLEMLAQEIYCLLKQRLQIERERQGGSYFGQLPW